MALSKTTRILILLIIDTGFFLLELSVGSAVHSLALVADSFHMLNDVLSLCVGYWAVKVASNSTASKTYTYGWQRAETLGALVNGVFLVALCLSIFLEAIQRLVQPQVVANPKLVLIVGCCGLASNLLGLFLFHEHGHGHSHGHGHGQHGDLDTHADSLIEAEEGQRTGDAQDANGVSPKPIADGSNSTSEHRAPLSARQKPRDRTRIISDESAQGRVYGATDATSWKAYDGGLKAVQPSHHQSMNRPRSRAFSTLDEISIHPASLRNDIIAAARLGDESLGSDIDADESEGAAEAEDSMTDVSSPVVNRTWSKSSSQRKRVASKQANTARHDHHTKQGHGHGDLNMRGVFLHVMGDALGNLGVIGSALFIWLTKFSWRYYADPIISLLITIIILASAIPLCKAASRILLQAVPAGISVDDIKEEIEQMPGIISAHHLHVWQLSDTKLVASLHVQVGFDFKGQGSARYMTLARSIRQCLHRYGIHSSTIQPEFCLDASHDHSVSGDVEQPADDAASANDRQGASSAGRLNSSKQASKANSLKDEHTTCLLECDDSCGDGKQCCAVSVAGPK